MVGAWRLHAGYMDLLSLLEPGAVRVLGTASSKRRLLQDMAIVFQSVYGLKSEEVSHALLEREGLGPTGVGYGVALPHARVSGLDKVVGVFAMLDKPVDFDAVDRQPVDLVFGLLAPHEAGVEHLRALALVSRTLRSQSTCAKLRANPDPATLYTILSESAPTKAA